ncbi:hypothetical protein MASR2M47_11090 [Draconibacterium sp.]
MFYCSNQLINTIKDEAKAMLNSNLLNPSAKADGNTWLSESDFVRELPFTSVNGYMEY